MSEQSSANISPLHRQLVKNRAIVVTEDPRLHLVWFQARIFIKPLPLYLTSYAFWAHYLLPLPTTSPLGRHQPRLCKEALGFLRTYHFLIRHQSDFRIAVDMHLLPSEVTWGQFCAFSRRFESIADMQVSSRYQYGELRLSRLNFYAKIFLRRQHYHRVYHQTDDYFARFYGTILFLFAIATVGLTAMQLEIQLQDLQSGRMAWFSTLCHLMSFMVILAGLLILGLLVCILVSRQWREWRHALTRRAQRKRESRRIGTRRTDEMV